MLRETKTTKERRPRFRFFFFVVVLPCWFVANSSARLFHFIFPPTNVGRASKSAGEVAAIRKRTQTLCLRTDRVRQKEKVSVGCSVVSLQGSVGISHPPFWIYTHKSDGISTSLMFHRSLNPQSLFLTPRLLFPSRIQNTGKERFFFNGLPSLMAFDPQTAFKLRQNLRLFLPLASVCCRCGFVRFAAPRPPKMQKNPGRKRGGDHRRGRNDRFHAFPSVVEQVETLSEKQAAPSGMEPHPPITDGVQSKC